MAGVRKYIGIALLQIILTFSLSGQELSNKRTQKIPANKDTIVLDSLSIIPNSLTISDDSGNIIDTSYYQLFPARGILTWKKKLPSTNSLTVTYRVFPISLNKNYRNKSRNLIDSTPELPQRRKIYKPKEESIGAELNQIERNGNISRGITFGNNQDLSLNSNLDLQLAGDLTDKIGIKAAVTDQNLPIQPEGNSAQLQDFDKVYIQLFTNNETLTLGDFTMRTHEKNYFMNFYKKTQGIGFEGDWNIGKNEQLKAGADLGFSRGKFARNVINGREGDQGPYQLTGNNNERYIIVISGTERVFLNGEKLKRGEQYDYTIDYNSGEITFTNEHLITQYDRIVVEFQYAKRSYERSVLHTYGNYKNKRLSIRANFYSEQDHKNNPLYQELTQEDKQKLAEIGDSTQKAVVSGAKQQEYDQDRIMYKKIDTLGYSEVFVHSTNPDSANYVVQFSDVGRGNGNYIQKLTNANGQVYQWVEPQNGQMQGRYSPVKKLITPKKQQMVTLSSEYKISENATIGFETAISNRDENTFSKQGNGNDKGNATRAFAKKTFPLSQDTNSWAATTYFSFEYKDKQFHPIERYRPVEFQRQWDRQLNNPHTGWESKNERLANVSLNLKNNRNFTLNYAFKNFSRGVDFTGRKHEANLGWNWNDFDLDLKSDLTNVNKTYPSQPDQLNTYWKQKGMLKHHFNIITLGGGYKREISRRKTENLNLLDSNSFQYEQWHLLAESPDTFQNPYKIKFTRRKDFLPAGNSENFNTATRGTNISLQGQLNSATSDNNLNYGVTYRNFQIQDSSYYRRENKPERSITGNLEGNVSFLNETIESSTYYELGSGKEQKTEFQFIRVRGEGRGTYVWNDYNNNNTQELNEFEPATNSNDYKANFIRVITPTNQYIRSISNELRENLTLDPAKEWLGEEGVKKWIAKFTNETNMRIERKVLNRDRWKQYFPTSLKVADSNLVKINSELKNTIYFNKTDPLFGLFYTYRNQKRKQLRLRGFDTRTKEENIFHGRINFSRKWSFIPEYKFGEKSFSSDFFENRNYKIDYYEAAGELSFQPTGKFRLTAIYKNGFQKNKIAGKEKAIRNEVGLESTLNFIGKGNLSARVNYIKFNYNGDPSSPVSYEMLRGLNVGENWTWFLTANYKFQENLQLNLNYNGRTSNERGVIHQANVSARYLF